ncbi:restriction endonuclease [Corynebacterium durum]|uniref:restriction endonuclease n=1 Tax=Corynebacterium durum TaxID=61592 RepID=UPI0028E24265|nr:restriction endonuclease [Corynebacterium durum]
MSRGHENRSEIPQWNRLTPCVLRCLTDGQVHHRREILHGVKEQISLTDDQREERLNSGDLRVDNRIGWAISHLRKAFLIESPSRAHFSITDAGRLWLEEHPDGMDSAEASAFFNRYWPKPSGPDTSTEQLADPTDGDPDELMDNAQNANRQSLGVELLESLRESDPAFFEQVVVDLLLAMGYGGAEKRGIVIGQSGDGGIDGVIDQDALGLDQIYVQAKRYKEGNNISSETIQAFVGAIHGRSAQKGVFFTTSAFTPNAKNYAKSVPTHLVLIDGERLVNLMMKYRVGVQIKNTYYSLELDKDYFD